MREEFGGGPQVADAALPHPDRRRPADGAAARGQPRPGRDPGARRRPGRHAEPAHELLRRGDRAADRQGGAAGAADPAGHRVRDRRDQDGRPVRRLVRRGVADRRPGGRDRRPDRGRRGPRAEPSPPSRRASRRARSSGRRTRSPSRSTTASGSSSASTGSPLDEEEPYEPLRVDPPIEAEQRTALAALRAERDHGRRRPRPGRPAQGRRAARTTCCPRCGRRCGARRRSARSATRCATSGGPTSRATPSEAQRCTTSSDVDAPQPVVPPDHLSCAASRPRRALAPQPTTSSTVRRDLHAHPELAWQEHRTTALLAERLDGAGLTPRAPADDRPDRRGRSRRRHGTARVAAARRPRRPAAATTARPARGVATVDGVAHACGHDVHAAACSAPG